MFSLTQGSKTGKPFINVKLYSTENNHLTVKPVQPGLEKNTVIPTVNCECGDLISEIPKYCIDGLTKIFDFLRHGCTPDEVMRQTTNRITLFLQMRL